MSTTCVCSLRYTFGHIGSTFILLSYCITDEYITLLLTIHTIFRSEYSVNTRGCGLSNKVIPVPH